MCFHVSCSVNTATVSKTLKALFKSIPEKNKTYLRHRKIQSPYADEAGPWAILWGLSRWFDALSVAVGEKLTAWWLGNRWSMGSGHISCGCWWTLMGRLWALTVWATAYKTTSGKKSYLSLSLSTSFKWPRNGSRCGHAHETKGGWWRGCGGEGRQRKEGSSPAAGRSGARGPAEKEAQHGTHWTGAMQAGQCETAEWKLVLQKGWQLLGGNAGVSDGAYTQHLQTVLT